MSEAGTRGAWPHSTSAQKEKEEQTGGWTRRALLQSSLSLRSWSCCVRENPPPILNPVVFQPDTTTISPRWMPVIHIAAARLSGPAAYPFVETRLAHKGATTLVDAILRILKLLKRTTPADKVRSLSTSPVVPVPAVSVTAPAPTVLLPAFSPLPEPEILAKRFIFFTLQCLFWRMMGDSMVRGSPEAALLLEQLWRWFSVTTPEPPLQQLVIVEETLRKLLGLRS